MKYLIRACLCLALIPGALLAQKIDIEAIKSAAKTDASEFSELRALMRDDDPNVRLAAFDALVAHGDPSLYEIAVSMGISDIDEVVRARALWEILSRTRTLAILVDPGSEVTSQEDQKALAETYQGRMSLQVATAIKQENCINLYYEREDCAAGYNLTINGTRVSLVYSSQNIDGTLKLDSDGALRGTLRNTRLKIDFPVEIPLR